MPRRQVAHTLSKVAMIVAAVALSGTGSGDGRFGDTGQPVGRLSRPFGIGAWQIERCLLQEGRRDRLALSSAVLEIDRHCPIEQK
jgi:hypothetical protein